MGIRNFFSYNVRTLRNKLDLTQEELSAKSKLSLNTIKTIELNKGFTSDKSIDLIASALKVDPSDLFKNPNYKTPELPPLEALSIVEKALKEFITKQQSLNDTQKEAISLVERLSNDSLQSFVIAMRAMVADEAKLNPTIIK